MKSILKTSLVLFLTLWLNSAFAQAPRQLKIGDTLPNLMIKNLWKQNDQQTDLKTLRGGRFMMINFWATWCTPCLEEMKTLSEMSNKYSKSFLVLSVTHEKKTDIDKFLKKQSVFAQSKLEVVTDDQLLKSYFFYQTIPHNIWINDKGVICAITGSDEVNAETILKFIESAPMDLRTKIDEVFDSSKPLHIADSLIQFRSIFSSKLKNNHGGGSMRSPFGFGHPSMNRLLCYNLSIKDLFWLAYLLPGYIPNDYLYEIHTTDSARYFYPARKVTSSGKVYPYSSYWDEDHTYCYELITAKPVDEAVFIKHAVGDLELNLDVKTALEYRDKVCCLVSFNKLPDSIGPISNVNKTYLGIEDDRLIIKNISINKLLAWMTNETYKISENKAFSRREPYVDNTGINYTISAIVDMGKDKEKYHSAGYLEKQISKGLGLKFDLETRPYKVLVIRDVDR